MKTKHIAAAIVTGLACMANAQAAGHVAHLTETFYSGAIFDGVVTFNDNFDTITAIDGMVTGGGSSSPGGLDYNDHITFIDSTASIETGISRAEVSGPANFVFMLFTWNYGTAPTLTFSDAGIYNDGQGSIGNHGNHGNHLQPIWAPNANYVDSATGGSITMLSPNVTPVPEPATYGMLFAGLGLLGFITRRKARSGSF